jgi:hypothetical protein
MDFQQIVVLVAVIALLLILLFIGLTLRNAKSTEPWIPTPQACPDYWVTHDPSGNPLDATGSNPGGICVNVKNLGTCDPTDGNEFLTMDFSSSMYQGSNGNCAKYKWAKSCNITWDGITYGVAKNPCDTSTS